jgi:hypothetical protein
LYCNDILTLIYKESKIIILAGYLNESKAKFQFLTFQETLSESKAKFQFLTFQGTLRSNHELSIQFFYSRGSIGEQSDNQVQLMTD